MKQWIRDLASVKWHRGKYSQSYQDVLLERIFEHIGVRNTPPFCVEFGFNDASLTGGSGSNVANFVLHHGWRCLLLDGVHANPTINLHRPLSHCREHLRRVRRAWRAREPEYVSIDVDSTDLWLFRALLTRHKAMIYTVEYNSCFPAGTSHHLSQRRLGGLPGRPRLRSFAEGPADGRCRGWLFAALGCAALGCRVRPKRSHRGWVW